jgi:hypothetical protein
MLLFFEEETLPVEDHLLAKKVNRLQVEVGKL